MPPSDQYPGGVIVYYRSGQPIGRIRARMGRENNIAADLEFTWRDESATDPQKGGGRVLTISRTE